VSLRITRLRIDRFGPLRDLDFALGPLTIVVGDNEAGKSSIVDALHAWLRKRFRHANAVSWDGVRRNLPGYEGAVEIDLASENGSTPPGKLCDEPVLWNLLVIPEGRAGTRRVGMAQRDWLVEAKPHLTGFDAQTIRERLRERAGLTPTDRDSREWSDEDQRLARRRRAVESFLGDLVSLGAREAELRTRSSELSRLEEEAARERSAADFEPWRRLAAALDATRETTAELAELERYDERDLRAWRGFEAELARQAARQRDARQSRVRVADKLRLADDERSRAERAVAEAEQRLAELARAGIPRRVEEARRSGGAETAGQGLARASATALVAGAALIVAGLATSRWLAFAGAGVASAGVVLGFVARAARVSRVGARSATATLLVEARTLGCEATDLTAIERWIAETDQAALRARVALEGARSRVADVAERLEESAREEAAAEHEFELVEERIAELRKRTGVTSAEGLASRIEQRRRLEAERLRAAAELESGLPDRTPEEREREIRAHRAEDPGRAPTPGALSRLERSLADARTARAALERETVGALERGLQAIDQPDLAAARATLEATRRAQAERECIRAAALLALGVVDEAERDVEGQLDRAFSDPAVGAGAMFARLTHGRWSGLRRVDSALEAVAPNGSAVRAEALSRGTHDQLHFALRAALARRVLGEPGFFVWDDTFLTADPPRRRTLVATAVDLVVEGWQVVYLTVDPSIADLFAREAGTREGVECRILSLP